MMLHYLLSISSRSLGFLTLAQPTDAYKSNI